MLPLHLNASRDTPLRVACLGAHSDDIEIGCLGLLVELALSGRPMTLDWLVVAAGGARGEEAERSAAAWREAHPDVPLRLHAHAFRDGFLPFDGAAVKEAVQAFQRETQADLVLTQYRGDLHQDHALLGALARQVWRDCLILEYEIPKYDGDLDRPNCYQPLRQAAVDGKLAHLATQFRSQHEKPWYDGETFRGLMRLRGLECHSPSGYAEAFHAPKFVLA